MHIPRSSELLSLLRSLIASLNRRKDEHSALGLSKRGEGRRERGEERERAGVEKAR
jgi:hypothetical protein